MPKKGPPRNFFPDSPYCYYPRPRATDRPLPRAGALGAQCVRETLLIAGAEPDACRSGVDRGPQPKPRFFLLSMREAIVLFSRMISKLNFTRICMVALRNDYVGTTIRRLKLAYGVSP